MPGTTHRNNVLNIRMNLPVFVLILVLSGRGSGNFTCDPDSYCKGGTCEETGCVNGCEDGYYGRYCKTECNDGCKDKKCEDQGSCDGDCVDGKWGRMCTLDCWNRCSTCPKDSGSVCTKCREFYYGPLCSESCREKCSKTGCDMNGTCKQTCPDPSSTDCVMSCGIGCKVCNEITADCEVCHEDFKDQNCEVYCGDCLGSCTYKGCVDGCEQGYFGKECEFRCNAHCKDGLCDHVKGLCYDGCSIGYYGPTCRIPCKNCEDDRCNSQSGECILGCKRDFFGKKCLKPCDPVCSGFCTRFEGVCFTPPVAVTGSTDESTNNEDANTPKHVYIIIGSCLGFLLVCTIVCLLAFRCGKYACFREPRTMSTKNCEDIRMRTLSPVPRQTMSTCEYSYLDEDCSRTDDTAMVARGGREAANLFSNSVLLEQSLYEPHLSFENTTFYRSSLNPVELLDMRLSGLSGDFRSSASHPESTRSMINCWNLSRQHPSGRNKVCVYDVSGKYLLPVNDDTPNVTGV